MAHLSAASQLRCPASAPSTRPGPAGLTDTDVELARQGTATDAREPP